MKTWFSIYPQAWDDNWDGELRWYQKCYDHWGDRLRVGFGDLAREVESECGEPFGARFDIVLELYGGSGQFDKRCDVPAKLFEDHSLSFIFWRWGFYIAWRGRRK